ncbi:MAG: hypothetical protein IPK14_02805 [Blastocatellia bacterium]|nr:hypothetical protein [Blastocatellia bacterium]
MNKENHLESFVFTGSITSDIVIECFNLFASSLQRKTIVVLDNAPIHTSDGLMITFLLGATGFISLLFASLLS